MKHITTFKLFESSGMKKAYSEEEVIKTDEVIADIKDILLELSDIGYDTRVDYKVLSPRMIRKLMIEDDIKTPPEIQINITKKSEDRLLPLWNTEDEKMDFDEFILRVLRYAVDKGYKYEYEGIKSGTESIRAPFKGQVVNYSIRLYKE